MPTSTVSLPPNFMDYVWANVNSLFTGLNQPITAIVGIILGVVVLEILIGALKK